MAYYRDTSPWTMDGAKVDVVENNEHLGLIVSGDREEEKNIDARLKKARSSLFSLLGPAFSQKCLLSPVVKVHLFKLFTCPILRCGLSSMTIRPSQFTPIDVFHRKTLKSFLSLSDRASTAGIHFLLAELPLQARIHRDVFSLFYSIWSNPEAKIHGIVKYLMDNSPSNSRTWSIYLRNLAKTYELPDPLSLLQETPMPKTSFKKLVQDKIVAYWEQDLKERARTSTNLKYFNVDQLKLNGRPHPAIDGATTTTTAKELRPAVKMLLNDYYTFQLRSTNSNNSLSPYCRLPGCNEKVEDTQHVLHCPATSSARESLLTELRELVESASPHIDYVRLSQNEETMTQFLLDCSSHNLEPEQRIDQNYKLTMDVFKICRRIINATHCMRIKLLRTIIT